MQNIKAKVTLQRFKQAIGEVQLKSKRVHCSELIEARND